MIIRAAAERHARKPQPAAMRRAMRAALPPRRFAAAPICLFFAFAAMRLSVYDIFAAAFTIAPLARRAIRRYRAGSEAQTRESRARWRCCRRAAVEMIALMPPRHACRQSADYIVFAAPPAAAHAIRSPATRCYRRTTISLDDVAERRTPVIAMPLHFSLTLCKDAAALICAFLPTTPVSIWRYPAARRT